MARREAAIDTWHPDSTGHGIARSNAAGRRADDVVEGIVGYKVGLTATLRLGLGGAVARLRSVTDLPLIYDHQKAGPDVPDMAPKFSATCKEAGVDGLILFPIAGPRAVVECVGSAYSNRLLPIVGGDLPFPDYNASGGGYVIESITKPLDRSQKRS